MPVGASIAKLTATRAYGAHVHLVGETLDESLVEAARRSPPGPAPCWCTRSTTRTCCAGRARSGWRSCEQVPDVATVVVVGRRWRPDQRGRRRGQELRPDVRIVGVQAEQAAAWPESLAAGRPVRLRQMSTLADGIAVGEPSALTYAHVTDLVDEIVTVSEDQLSRAMLLCLERAKLVVEPAGAAAVAAIMARPELFTPPVVAVLSGGNIDPLVLLHVTQHGLVAAGRFLSLRIEISTGPARWPRCWPWSASSAASVVDVEHSRLGRHSPLGDVEVACAWRPAARSTAGRESLDAARQRRRLPGDRSTG